MINDIINNEIKEFYNDEFYNGSAKCKTLELKSKDRQVMTDYIEQTKYATIGMYKISNELTKVVDLDDGLVSYKLKIYFDTDY